MKQSSRIFGTVLWIGLAAAVLLLVAGCTSQHAPDSGAAAPGDPIESRAEASTDPAEDPSPEAPGGTDAGLPDQPADGAVPFEAQYLRTGSFNESAVYPRIRIVNSRDELLAFYRESVSDGTLTRLDPSDGLSACETATARWDDAFFADHSLIVVLLEEGSGSVRHEVTAVTLSSGVYQVDVNRIVPELGTCDMAEWQILIEIPKAASDAEAALRLQTVSALPR